MPVNVHFNTRHKAIGTGASLDALSHSNAVSVRNFHQTFAEYAPTPLHNLSALAKHLGLGRLLLKDESYRFGLNAFKVLGGSYAIGQILAGKLGRDLSTLSRTELCSDAVRKAVGNITFATTTDGNHGRGVAWTAQQLQQNAIIYMPKGSAQTRVDNIRAHGATCTVTDLNYDDAVRMTWDLAQQKQWIMVQDTAWEGYEDIPTWIMQGYMTLAIEALEQIQSLGTQPTHVFLQAGVGSFASAVLGYLAAKLGNKAPKFIIVEPHQANCIYTSALQSDGGPHAVTGDLDTLMAGLACGEPNTISWGMLRDYATAYISCPDHIAANGMRILATPLASDPHVTSGESGAVTTGIVQWLMQDPAATKTREQLGLNSSSQVLVISTEGDTSPETYRDVVWFGNYPNGAE